MEDYKCDERLCAVCGHSCSHSHGVKEIEKTPVSVEEMAERREARAARQAELIKEHGLPVVCFTMNIAGPHKYSEGIETCFNVGLEELAKGLSRFNAKLVHEEYVIEKTGCEAFLVYSGVNAKLLKAVAVKVEEETGFSRLFDIDVIDKSGEKLSRAGARKCLICGENAAECARSRKHSVEELQEKTGVLIREAVAYAASMAAYEAMISEVVTTPKAGLVDRNNNGANTDMDIPLFLKSAETLAPYFYSMAYLAADPALNESGHGEGCGESENINCADCPSHEGCSLDRSASLMTRLTILGVEAEARMKEATGGVNTHKGAIFCLGLLVTAFARLTALEKGRSPLDILEEVKRQAALRPEPGRGTNGFIARERFGASAPESAAFGADAQARAGFPAAAEAYRRMLGFKLMGFDENDSSALSLIGIMAVLYDTNAYSRAGSEGAEFVRERAKEIAGLPLSKRLAAVMDYDRELIARNINCGGAADMLAAAIFLDKLNKYSERRGGNEPHEHHHD